MPNSLSQYHRCAVPSKMLNLAYALACLILFCPQVTGIDAVTETTCSLTKALRSGTIFDVSFPSLIHDYGQPWADPRNAIPDSSYHDNPLFAYALEGNGQCVLQTYGGLDPESVWILTITSGPLITTPTLPRLRLDFPPKLKGIGFGDTKQSMVRKLGKPSYQRDLEDKTLPDALGAMADRKYVYYNDENYESVTYYFRKGLVIAFRLDGPDP